MSESEGGVSSSDATSRRAGDSRRSSDPDLAWPSGSASAEQPDYGPDQVHSVLTPAGQVESAGHFSRGLGPRRVKVLLFGTLGLVLVLGVVAELR